MKKVAVLLADGFEEIEALTTVDILRRAQIICDMISITNELVSGAHNITVKVDKVLQQETIEEYDMLVLPGGMPGATNLAKNNKVMEIIKNFSDNKKKYVAAICASPAVVLSKAGITHDKYITSYPGAAFESLLEESNYVEELVVIDDNIITSRGPATAMLFAYKLVDILGGNSQSLKTEMLWDMLEEEKE